VVIGFIVGHLAVALLYGAASAPGDPWRLGASIRLLCLGSSRLGLAICASFANIVMMMAVKVTPQESMVQFSIYRAGAMCLGASIGTLLASASIVWVWVPWILLGCAAFVVLPEDLEPLLATPAGLEDASGLGHTEPATPWKMLQDAREAMKGALKGERPDDENVVVASRKTLWMLAAAATLLRALLTAGFETTAAAIFLSDFLFSVPDVLLAAGSSLACGAFVVPLVVIAKHSGRLDIGRICTWASVCVAVAAVLLFRPFLHLSGNQTSGLWLPFLANALALPAAYLMTGILEGLALQQAVHDSPMNQENLLTVEFIMQDAMVRILGPPLMIFLYTFGGRSLCAAALLALASLACAVTFRARAALAAVSACNGESKQSLINSTLSSLNGATSRKDSEAVA